MKNIKIINDPIIILAIASVILGVATSGATLAHIGEISLQSISSALVAGGAVSIFVFIAIGAAINMMRPSKPVDGQ